MIAGLCAILFFWSRFLGGTAGWLEVTLFVLGILFIGLEIFVIPGFGVAGVGGLAAAVHLAGAQGLRVAVERYSLKDLEP